MEIAAGVYSLTTTKGFDVHAFLIDTGDGLLLIDTLFDPVPTIVTNEIHRLGRTLADLHTIVLTHAHRSHLGGLAALKRLSEATVCAHAWEIDIIAGERNAQAVSWRPQTPLNTYHYQIANNLNVASHPPCRVDQPVEDGDQLGPLEVIHAPGHSPGHLAFYLPEQRVLFTGDAVVTSPKFMGGWPGFTLNAEQQAATLRRLAAYDVEVVAVGHGEPIIEQAKARLWSLMAEADA